MTGWRNNVDIFPLFGTNFLENGSRHLTIFSSKSFRKTSRTHSARHHFLNMAIPRGNFWRVGPMEPTKELMVIERHIFKIKRPLTGWSLDPRTSWDGLYIPYPYSPFPRARAQGPVMHRPFLGQNRPKVGSVGRVGTFGPIRTKNAPEGRF